VSLQTLLKKASYEELISLYDCLPTNSIEILREAKERPGFTIRHFKRVISKSSPLTKSSYQQLKEMYPAFKGDANRRTRIKKEAMTRPEYQGRDFRRAAKYGKYQYVDYTYPELVKLFASEDDRSKRHFIKREAKKRPEYQKAQFFLHKFFGKSYTDLIDMFNASDDGVERGQIKRKGMVFSEYKDEDFPRLKSYFNRLDPFRATAFNMWYYKKMTLEEISKSGVFENKISRERVRNYINTHLANSPTKYYSERILIRTCRWCGVEESVVLERTQILTKLKRDTVKSEKFLCSLCSQEALMRCGNCGLLFYTMDPKIRKAVCNPCNAKRQREFLAKNPEYYNDPERGEKNKDYLKRYNKTRNKRIKNERILKGLCTSCGEPVDQPKKYATCKICRDKYTGAMRKRIADLKAKGLCPKCKGPRDKDELYIYCAKCRKKDMKKKKKAYLRR